MFTDALMGIMLFLVLALVTYVLVPVFDLQPHFFFIELMLLAIVILLIERPYR